MTTRLFSNKYTSQVDPTNFAVAGTATDDDDDDDTVDSLARPPLPFEISNCNCMNFPNRDELSFLIVVAFPKASNKGLLSKIRCTIVEVEVVVVGSRAGADDSEIVAKCCKHILTVSVLPAPDSPDTKMD